MGGWDVPGRDGRDELGGDLGVVGGALIDVVPNAALVLLGVVDLFRRVGGWIDCDG